MAANNETRTLKSNSIEELRQKSNEVSLHLGDNGLIDSRILDKTESFTATAGQKVFTSNTLRFELKPEETIDLAAESVSVGVVKVFDDGAELTQGTATANFIVPNFSLLVTLQNTPTIPAEFIEDAVLTQSGGFSGTLLSADTSVLRFKAITGTFNAGQNIGIPHTDAAKRIVAADLVSSTVQDPTYGNIIKLNTASSAGDVIKIVSTNLIDAVNEVQDDVGDITALAAGIPTKTDVVVAVNSFKGEVGNAVDLTPAANTVVGAINEHETDIGTVASLTTTGNDLVTAINEHDTELGTISAAAFGTTASTVSTAIAELHTDVDARFFLTKGSQQTINSDATFTNGNTLVFPSGSTLDIRNGLLQTGSGGLSVSTAFIDFNSDLDERGLSFERSDFGNGVDVKLIWDEAYAASQPDRAFRVIGLNTGATTETADLVTFYNAQDLIANNVETGIDVTWDSTNQNFDFALSADPTITLGGDLSGAVTLTNLASGTLTATIAAGSVENTMLAGSIAASKLAGSIGNSKLSNSSITVSDGSNTSPIALGGTLTFAGTSGEVDIVENAGTVTVGLPNNVTVGGNLTITGNLDVNGTQTTINTATLEIDDTLVLMGASATEPTTGGFGLETRSFTGVGTHSNNAANVTGSHSIVYNFATDRWEADGSLILSEASAGVPGIKVSSAASALSEQDFGSTNALDFNEGSGITILGATSGTDIDVTITNSDKGSSQNIFKNVLSDSGTAVADTNNDTLSILGGNNLSTSTSADALTIQHDNSGVSAASYGSQLVVPSITVDARGHVTAASSNTAISLSALGYSGSANADNYGSFSIRANANAAEAIGSGETITFTNSGATTVTRSGNTIDISSVNTQLSDAQVRSKFSAGSNVTISGSGVIAATNTNTVTNLGANNTNYTSGNINIVGTNATSVSKSGNTITITSADTNTDTDTITNIGANGGTYSSGNISFNSGSNTTVSKSGNTVTISSTDTNTTYSNLNQFTNGPGYVTSSGVTSVATGNGLTGGTITTSGTLSMSGSYTGTFTASADVVAYSDKKLKDNVETLDGSKVFDMRGVSFNRNDQDGKLSSGVIAQELEMIAPELIHEAEDGTKGVAYGNTVGYLIEAIKLLKAEIEELKSINKKV
jgi:hypothetical protein